MTCQLAGTNSDGVKAIWVARAARQAGRSVRGVRAAVLRARRAGLRVARAGPRAAQSTPRVGKTLLALMWTKRRRLLGGERRLVGEPVYRARIDGQDG